MKKSRTNIKICCGVSATTLIILVVVFITLFFTVFKPKNPQISLHPSNLEKVAFRLFPFSLNANLGLVITIQNQNLARFWIKNSTASVNYHGNLVGEIPIEATSVPAKGEMNISTYAAFTADKLISSPYFVEDVIAGRLNLTATANLNGKGYIFKIIKLGAKVYCSCNISIHILTEIFESSCNSRLNL